MMIHSEGALSIDVLSAPSQALRQLRRKVFIDEQHVPEALEWDKFDDPQAAIHFQLTINHCTIGGARLTPKGQIGRVFIAKNQRRQGFATKLLERVIDCGLTQPEIQKPLYLHAQVDAMALYQVLGFKAQGDEFLEAGIVHRTMVLTSTPPVNPNTLRNADGKIL